MTSGAGRKPAVEAYRRLDLPADPHTFLDRIVTALDRAARAAARGLPPTVLPRSRLED